MHAVDRARSLVPALDRLPLPGRGSTIERWRALADLGRDDLSVARLAEGHADARAILDELGHPVPAGLLGVWAAQPDRLEARPTEGGWTLQGEKGWCSGSQGLDRALVTATAPDGPRLFVVDPADASPVPGSWRPMGMEATRSDTLTFAGTPVGDGAAVGGPGAYVARPGFGHGGCGVAAVWWGGAAAVAEVLRTASSTPGASEAVVGAHGEVVAALEAGWAVLATAAAAIDADPTDRGAADRRALVVRLAVERAARTALDLTTQVLGATALCQQPEHAARVADLTVYLAQLVRSRSALALGRADVGAER